jgi:hypothetical protein
VIARAAAAVLLLLYTASPTAAIANAADARLRDALSVEARFTEARPGNPGPATRRNAQVSRSIGRGQGGPTPKMRCSTLPSGAATHDCLADVLLSRTAAIPSVSTGGPQPSIAPPSRYVVEDSVSKALPAPLLGIDPAAEGLTGLEAYLWYRDDGRSPLEPVRGRRGLSVTATAGPHTITARAWIVEYRWDMGDGSRYVTRAPGSPSNPAARHVYERKGNYTITVETVWAGEYTWQLEGASGAGELGPVSRASTQSYGVVEVRSVLVG